ncbi:unnamed protein product, partial [Amoebophrya sp. A25]
TASSRTRREEGEGGGSPDFVASMRARLAQCRCETQVAKQRAHDIQHPTILIDDEEKEKQTRPLPVPVVPMASSSVLASSAGSTSRNRAKESAGGSSRHIDGLKEERRETEMKDGTLVLTLRRVWSLP